MRRGNRVYDVAVHQITVVLKATVDDRSVVGYLGGGWPVKRFHRNNIDPDAKDQFRKNNVLGIRPGGAGFVSSVA